MFQLDGVNIELFEGTRTVGVAYLTDGNEQQVQAKKEVILSSGAINSPQILMLSGVGPADQLQKFGIRVVADLPGVGNNLQDHPYVTYYTTKQSFSEFGNSPEGKKMYLSLTFSSALPLSFCH